MLRLTAILLVLVVCSAFSLAATDLAVSDIRFVTAPNGDVYAEVWVNVAMDADQPSYVFDFQMQQMRNGAVVRTWTANDLPVTNRTNCISCSGTCGGTCAVEVSEKEFPGHCKDKGSACHSGGRHCICGADDPEAILKYLLKKLKEGQINDPQPGDTFSVDIPVDSPTVDTNVSNNSMTVTY